MVRIIIVAALVFGALAAEEQPVASDMVIRVSPNSSAMAFIEAMCSAATQVVEGPLPGSDQSPLAIPTTAQPLQVVEGPLPGSDQRRLSPAASDTLSIIDLVPGMYLGSKT